MNGDDGLWRAALGMALNGTRNVLPIIPRYAEFPYAAVVGKQDPGGIERVFDDRYFPATNELNLLNSLLIAEDGAGA